MGKVARVEGGEGKEVEVLQLTILITAWYNAINSIFYAETLFWPNGLGLPLPSLQL